MTIAWRTGQSGEEQKKHLLFLSHCVPYPPDKGEKIRCFQEIEQLRAKYDLHVFCFAQNDEDLRAADEFARSGRCASIYVEKIPSWLALCRGLASFGFGSSLNFSYFRSAKMRRAVAAVNDRVPFECAIAYSAVMAQYVPHPLAYVLDMIDVDSEKWIEYGKRRSPGFVYRLEARRLRRLEVRYATKAQETFFTTAAEAALFRGFAGGASARSMENGVDLNYFDPTITPILPELRSRRYLLFLGTMDYYPNSEAAEWFANEIFPHLRERDKSLEFFIVGRNSGKRLLELRSHPGVVVTGAVADVRPYLRSCLALVAPMQIARGIQNKVLEALAMEKPVLASPQICKTFGSELPQGVLRVETLNDFVSGVSELSGGFDACVLRAQTQERFDWARNLDTLLEAVEMTVAKRASEVTV